LQPLDVGLFGPLKKALSAKLDPLIRTQVSRLQKSEWLRAYVNARIVAFTRENVWGGWRGAELFLFNPDRVLSQVQLPAMQVVSPVTPLLPPPKIPSIPIDPELFETSLLNSSPPDATTLQKTNAALTTLVETKTPLFTPARKYIRRLASKSEQLRAENSILKTRLQAATDLLSARQNRTKGKHIALKDQLLLTTEEIRKTVEEIEKAEQKRAKKKRKCNPKKRGRQVEIEPEDEEGVDSDNSDLPEGILSCIVVAPLE
jgi:hypothetical protein